MRPGEFIINGISSLTLHTVIQDRPLIKAPSRKIVRNESSGRSGTLPMDTGQYKNSPLELILYSSPGKNKEASDYRDELYNLFDSGGYNDIIFYFDPSKVYKVLVEEEEIEFESKYYYDGGQSWRVNLSVFPWKYYINSASKTLTAPGGFVNPHISESKPLIKVEGSGNITLDFNGEKFQMKGLKSYGIILDSEVSLAYHVMSGGKLESENDKIYSREYPTLRPGRNDISWTGNVTKLTIEPRWRTKV